VDETKENHQLIIDNFKNKEWIGKTKQPVSQRKLDDGNLYVMLKSSS
jgi:hypothetical protein